MASHNTHMIPKLSKQERSNALMRLRQSRATYGFKVYNGKSHAMKNRSAFLTDAALAYIAQHQ